MRLIILHVAIAIASLLVLSACHTRGQQTADGYAGYGQKYPMTDEVASIMDSCMSHMHTSPATSHRMIDSVRHARLLSPQRCDYLHAMVLYSGEAKSDSALAICNRLLDEDDFGDDNYIEEEICVLASNITSIQARLIETLRYAHRGIALCHGDERLRNDEATLLSRVGWTEQRLGRYEQARESYLKAYELLREDKSFGGLIALMSIIRKQAGLLSDTRQYDQAISAYQEVLDLVQRFDRDPSFVEPRPETMRESSPATRDFADFYESQMYCRIAGAYRQKIEQGLSADPAADSDSVAHYVELWSHTASSCSSRSKVEALPELFFAGRMAEFADAAKAAGSMFETDSLVSDYVDYLSLMAREAAQRHDLSSSNAYLQRAIAVSDSIRQQDLLRTLAEQLSVHMVQQEQLARQDAEYQVTHQRYVILLLSSLLILLVAGAVIGILIRRNRDNMEIIQMTQQDLTESQAEVKELAERISPFTEQLETVRTDEGDANMLALYRRIEELVIDQELYLDPDCDIRKITEQLCSSRTVISICINCVTGKTFRQWLSEQRLARFVQLLREKPGVPIEDLMLRCGYKDQSTFRRQFKAAYGTTAGEYRRRLDDESSKSNDTSINS